MKKIYDFYVKKYSRFYKIFLNLPEFDKMFVYNGFMDNLLIRC